MKKPLTLIGLAFALALLAGCAPYQSQINIGSYKFSFPKDASFAYLQASVPTSNGVASVVISNGVFKMNPAVIDAKTAHDAALISATAAAVGTIAGAVAKP